MPNISSVSRLLVSLCACILLAIGTNESVAATSITRTTAWDYDATTGLLTKEIVEHSDSAFCVVNAYTLDDYGHRTATVTRNCDASTGTYPGAVTEAAAPGAPSAFTKRTTTNTYSSDKRFVATVTNAAEHQESRTYDGRFGGVSTLTGPNDLTTRWAYDGFGRKVIEKRPDGNGTKWEYQYCTGAIGGTLTCPAISGGIFGSTPIVLAYAITTTPVASPIDVEAKTTGAANGPYVRVYFDSLDREVRTETVGFDGKSLVYQDTEYDFHGQIYRKSRPYYAGGTRYWNVYDRDKLGRVISVDSPTDSAANGTSTKTLYSGLRIVVTDPLGHTTTQVKNIAGQVETITDAIGGTLTKVYDPVGNTVQTTDARGNVISVVLDKYARNKTALYDPDMGVITYIHDALGQMVQQTDAKGQVVDMSYDVLGRMVKRYEPSLRSDWYYDRYSDVDPEKAKCSHGIGQLCQVTAGLDYGRKMEFDEYGRLSRETSSVGATLAASVGYDNNGRVSRQTYPSGLSVTNVYTTLGFLRQVQDARTESALWTLDSMDAEGHVTQFTHGNNLVTTNGYAPGTGHFLSTRASIGDSSTQYLSSTYDKRGNPLTRADVVSGVTSVYAYDELDRLKSETRLGGGVSGNQSLAWTYDSIGNMTSRDENGTVNKYQYNSSGSGSLRPHAVANVSGTVNGVLIPIYSYDANGNMTSGAGRGIGWFSFDKVQSITKGGATLSYLYDADHERAREAYYLNGALRRTTIYLNSPGGGSLFYEEETGVAGTKKKHYITAAGSTVAMIVCSGEQCTNAATTSTQYWHQDQQGSNSAITDSARNVIERLAYEPFGKRRYSSGLTDANGSLTAGSTDRGYTGHEHMDEVGLINMNGRVFDPALGRFMSPDPGVTLPQVMQAYNRYSYTYNNPMGWTDPSGFDAWGFEENGATTQATYNYYAGRNTSGFSGYVGGYGGPYLGSSLDFYFNSSGLNSLTREAFNRTEQFFSGDSFAALGTSAMNFLGEANRSFGFFDRFVPDRESFRRGAGQLMGGPCFYNCDGYNVLVELTADVMQGSAQGVAEAGNRYYPELAKQVAFGAVAEGSLIARIPSGAANIANGSRLGRELLHIETSELFVNGGLRADVIAGSKVAIPGSQLNNPALVRALTADGSNIADWAKMTTRTFRSPSGDFQAHFYQNLKTGATHFADDFKVVFNHNGAWK